MKLILASSSPRRKDLLTTLGIAFDVIRPDIDERPKSGETPVAYAKRNAKEKAEAVMQVQTSPCVVISADTIVVIDQTILEKPNDHMHAKAMLAQLSAREHVVVTAYSICSPHQNIERQVETKVLFRALSADEIAAYVASGEPMDKAGSYAAQGKGAQFVKAVIGSYTNVIGLPLAELSEDLRRLGVIT